MISAPDRRCVVELIKQACAAGARLQPACAELGLSMRTYQRWQGQDGVKQDARPLAPRAQPHKLSEAERARMLEVVHRPEFASLPPAQIVPRLADQGQYLASESSFYRVLREANEHPLCQHSCRVG